MLCMKGIIPAYAESTIDGIMPCLIWTDHPHVCGEHSRGVELVRNPAGSSPRMRGAHSDGRPAHDGQGIIPAYAGSTIRIYRLKCPGKDHPRVCGEHGSHPPASDRLPGSSPRMRGAPDRPSGDGPVHRIIPAYAGSTDIAVICKICAPDHPRVCGEHRVEFLGGAGDLGSSPRMRGALQLVVLRGDLVGIIPAYAGST